MTAIRLDRPTGTLALPGFPGHATGLLDLVRARVGRWLRNRRAERQMSALSDHELRDIGITRADIARAAWHGRV